LNSSTNSSSDRVACCSDRTANIFDDRLLASSQAEARTSSVSIEGLSVCGEAILDSGTKEEICSRVEGLQV
jgi:hypothetical protein